MKTGRCILLIGKKNYKNRHNSANFCSFSIKKQYIRKFAFPLLFFLALSSVHGFEPEISEAKAGGGMQNAYNQSFHYFWDIFAFGSIEINKILLLGGGFSAGQSWDILTIDAYAFTEAAIPFFRKYVPVNLKFAYIYNGLPDYETHIHTMLPLIQVGWRYFGFSIGETLRFTYFSDGPALFEPILAYAFYANFYHTDDATVGIKLANFTDFASNNLGSYFFSLTNRFRLTPLISIAGELKIDMSGNVGRLTSVYGLSFREGVVFTW